MKVSDLPRPQSSCVMGDELGIQAHCPFFPTKPGIPLQHGASFKKKRKEQEPKISTKFGLKRKQKNEKKHLL